MARRGPDTGSVDPALDPERRSRAGDQPLPVVTTSSYVKDLLLNVVGETRMSRGVKARAKKFIKDRAELGKRRYGVYLQVENGRDVIRDLTEEVFDALMYSVQLRYASSSWTVQNVAGKYSTVLLDMWLELLEHGDTYRDHDADYR